MSQNDLLWKQKAWFDSATTWIIARLTENNIEVLGKIEQPHVRPWSTVFRVAVSGGMVFFKASAPYFEHETELTNYLAQAFPEISPEVISYDPDRHWLLMRDSGTPLRTFIRAEQSIERWQGILPSFVGMQKALSGQLTDLLDLGVPDRRLNKVPDLFFDLLADQDAMLLDQPDSLTTDEFGRLKRFDSEFRNLCEHLASFGIPESLYHDDLHDGNIFLQGQKAIFTDWGESAVTHPFFSLVVMLRSVENSLNLPPEAPEVQSLREWYLRLWSDYAPLKDLLHISKLAERIGYVNRALTWHKVISNLPDQLKAEYAIAVPAYLKEFINSKND